jgi:hypothetical protein
LEPLQAIAAWPVAAWLRESAIAYPLLNAAHIASIGLLLGAIVTLDLRLLGAFRSHPLAHLGPPLRRVASVGLGLAVTTGLLLFTTRPVTYAENPAFQIKLGLLALGVLNVVALHRTGHWRRALDGAGPQGPARTAAAVSLLVWTGAVVAGRWIGFLQ